MALLGDLELLPIEIRTRELYPQLDPLTKLVFRFLLFGEEPPALTPDEQKQVCGYSLAYFKFFFKKTTINPLDVAKYAAAQGQLEILNWAYEQGCPRHSDACDAAVKEGRLETLIWMIEHEWPTFCLSGTAIKSSRLDILEWLDRGHEPWTEYTLTHAILRGELDIAVAIHDRLKQRGMKECELSRQAAAVGRLDVLKWCRSRGYHDPKGEFLTAIRCRQLEVMEWLGDELWDKYFTSIVASNWLPMIQQLYRKFPHRKDEMLVSHYLSRSVIQWLLGRD